MQKIALDGDCAQPTRVNDMDGDCAQLTWLKIGTAPRPQPWARLRVPVKVGSAGAEFFLLVNKHGSHWLVEKRYEHDVDRGVPLSQSILGQARLERTIALELASARCRSILRSVPAIEMLLASGSLFMPAEHGVQLFSDFAPGGSLNDWITAAAGRDTPFGLVVLAQDSVRSVPVSFTVCSTRYSQPMPFGCSHDMMRSTHACLIAAHLQVTSIMRQLLAALHTMHWLPPWRPSGKVPILHLDLS